jgi:hypothetical protein
MRETEARLLLESAVADVPTASPPIDILLHRGRSSHNRHRALTLAGAFVIALLLVGLGTTTTALLTNPSPVSTQPLGADATPEQVIQAFVAAKNARDEKTALSLATPHHAAQLRSTQGGPLGDTGPFGLRRAKPITDLHLEPPDAQYPRAGGGSQADDWQQAVFVRATYQRNGNNTQWGYLMVRNTTTERWSIADEGPV